MAKLVDKWKTRKIMALIDQQIVMRQSALFTLVELKKSLQNHMVRDQLSEVDLDYIRKTLKELKQP